MFYNWDENDIEVSLDVYMGEVKLFINTFFKTQDLYSKMPTPTKHLWKIVNADSTSNI